MEYYDDPDGKTPPRMKYPINKFGFVAGFIVWCLLTWFVIGEFECMEYGTCERVDIFWLCIMGVGLLGPAWLVATISTAIISGK